MEAGELLWPLDWGYATSPWRLIGQRTDTDKQPHEVFLEVAADLGAEYPSCPECGRLCTAHDFHGLTWRHLNLFQHRFYVTARVPQVDAPNHGTKQVKMPWTSEGIGSPCCSNRLP